MSEIRQIDIERQQKLIQRWFSDDVEEKEDVRIFDEYKHMLAVYSSLIQQEGWGVLKKKLERLSDDRDVRAGSEQEMLYQIGRRDGVRDVLAVLRAIEQELRDE